MINSQLKILYGVFLASQISACSSSNFSGQTKSAKKDDQPQKVKEQSPENIDEKNESDIDTDDKGKDDDDNDDDLGKGVDKRSKCGSSTEKTLSVDLQFPATRGQSCPWNMDFNLSPSPTSKTVRAIRTQEEDIEAPDGSVICSVELEGKSPSITYDDYIMFTFDDFLIASAQFPKNEFLSAGMTEEKGIIKFVGQKTVGSLPTSPAVNLRTTPQYCAEGGTCQIPLSQQTGALSIAVPSTWFDNLPKDILKKTKLPMRVIVTGQGHESPAGSDCGHTGISFTAHVKYVK